MNTFLTVEAMKILSQSLSLPGRFFGRVIRLRRRGFRRDIRRGDEMPWPTSTDGKAYVVRRSRHSLWLEVDRPKRHDIGDTIKIRVPERYGN